jgi:NAD(P)-dependent dehydrogenase (short-subunit alcohol dehydrogenase family)
MAVVLVTGGSSGIGLATVRRLAASGHHVFAASRDPGRADLPDGVTAIAMDIADPAAATAAVNAVLAGAGRIDALVNNAGTGVLGPIEETDDADAHQVFEVNVFGPMRLARAAIAAMRDQGGGGRIVNVTSMNDVLPAPFGGWYSASKAALASLSLVLDAEVRDAGISVTVVAPGLFRTEMSDAMRTYELPPSSRYRDRFEALRQQNAARLDTAADPDIAARVIADCIECDEAPARAVAGDDAEQMLKLVRDIDTEQLASMLREFVQHLGTS